MVLKVSERALSWLAERGYDPQFGARPMKRVLQRDLVDGLSSQIISDTFQRGDTIYIDLAEDKLSYSTAPFDPAAEFVPTGETAAKKRRRRAAKKQKDNVEELKKATDDLNDAIAEVKED